jgi:sec-independent protein translocase protein TatA
MIKMLFSNLIMGLSPAELMVVGMIILVLFGGRKIPELMKGLGQGIREFNNAKANIESEVKENMKEIDSSK